jgi:hypothetical protein
LKSRSAHLVTAALLAGALALAAPAAAGAASPAKGGHGSTTTTTTTKPGASGGQSSPFATLVIKPASIGHVSVETAGTTTFQPATNNEQLHVGDTVQTDSVGLAEIDYASNAYTRLNVNTTFTIKKLTDNQGNRQIDGGITSGETWNRTAQLTQSESFQQDGGGVSAAVSGTAFVVDCMTPTQCTFTAVIDDTHLTGPNGQTQTLNPLTQCVTQNSALCASPTMLTPDQLALIQWIQYNVFLDLAEHGIGNGIFEPFGAQVTITNGVITSVTPTTGGQPAGPTFTPTPPGAPVLGTPAIQAGETYQGTTGDGLPSNQDSRGKCAGLSGSPGGNEIDVGDDCSVDFHVSAADPGGSFVIKFTFDTTMIGPTGFGQLFYAVGGGAKQTVQNGGTYDPADVFTFFANDIGSTDVGTPTFTLQAIDTLDGLTSQLQTVTVNVQSDCDDTDPVIRCAGSDAAAVPTPPATSADASISPTTTAPATTETTTANTQPPAGAAPTPSTTTTTTATSGGAG